VVDGQVIEEVMQVPDIESVRWVSRVLAITRSCAPSDIGYSSGTPGSARCASA